MYKDRLKEILLDQKEVFSKKTNLIDRDIDLEKYIQTQQVVIISGIRRCGKSSLLYLMKERMKLDDRDYCYFNFDDERITADSFLLENLFNLHIEIYGREPVLFFDEIQNVPSWEKFINRIYEKGLKVFVTGSNARLLSSEISTSLTGRNKVLELFPFSFREFIRFLGNSYNPVHLSPKQKGLVMKDFNHYFSLGGFPLVIKENDLELINAYFQDILYRDIVSRYRLSQIKEIKEIGLYFVSNVGKLFSYSTLQSVTGVKSLSSISDYLGYYEQSYLFFFLKKFDYSIKKQIMNPKKVYSIDQGFIHRLGFNFSENRGRILENIVLIELLRQGKEVYYHAGKYECDFLIKDGLKIVEAIQVVYSLNTTNFNREYNGLKEAMNTYGLKQGLILVNDMEVSSKMEAHEEVKTEYVWKWMLTYP